MNKKSFLSRRWQMAFVGVGLWFLLLLWSASAFWQHIDALKVTYQLASKCGALAGEFALLAMVLWHCFDKHIGVRRWSLILAFILAGVILVHAGALRGMHDAEIAQTKTVDQLTDKLGELSKQQIETGSKAAGQIGNEMRSSSQRERMWAMNKQIQKANESGAEAQRLVASEISKSVDKVKDASILPRWYLDGWCYSVIFILSLAFVGIIFLLMMNQDDIDEDYDGVPDAEQQDRDQWRVIAERRREYGDQLRAKYAQQERQDRPKPIPRPIAIEEPASKPEAQVINGKDRTSRKFDSH